MIAVNSHWLLRGFWNIVWKWLDEFIQQKIILCGYGEECVKNCLEYVDEEVLEE